MTSVRRTILVTGASADSDIGLAICLGLANANHRLVLVGRREEALEATRGQLSGEGHQVAPFDLGNLDEIKPWLKELTREHGPLDGLVHSASFQGYSPLRTVTPAHIRQYFDVNFSAALMLTAGLAKPKHHNSGASLVYIGSAAGLRGLKARSLYAASKAALSSLAQTAALELAPKQIRVNCVAPAVVSGAKADQQLAMLSPEQAESLKAAHPLGFSRPQDVANAVLFLIGDASRNITGVTLPVDGGYLAG